MSGAAAQRQTGERVRGAAGRDRPSPGNVVPMSGPEYTTSSPSGDHTGSTEYSLAKRRRGAAVEWNGEETRGCRPRRPPRDRLGHPAPRRERPAARATLATTRAFVPSAFATYKRRLPVRRVEKAMRPPSRAIAGPPIDPCVAARSTPRWRSPLQLPDAVARALGRDVQQIIGAEPRRGSAAGRRAKCGGPAERLGACVGDGHAPERALRACERRHQRAGRRRSPRATCTGRGRSSRGAAARCSTIEAVRAMARTRPGRSRGTAASARPGRPDGSRASRGS